MSRDALLDVFRQANVRKRVEQEIYSALLAAQLPGGSPDDVAACLLRWSASHGRSILACVEARRRQKDGRWLKRVRERSCDLSDVPEEVANDVQGQMLLPGAVDVADSHLSAFM